MPPTTERTRCVVLLPVEGELDDRLAAVMDERGWQASPHQDPYFALAEVGLRHRAQASRADWGLQPTERTVFLLGHREVLERGRCDCPALIDNVRRYFPGIAVYEYRAGRLHDLTGIDGEPVPRPAVARSPAAAPPHPPTRQDVRPGPGILRLTHPPEPAAPPVEAGRPNGAGGDEAETTDEDDRPISPAAVTREEIDMLLELDPGEMGP